MTKIRGKIVILSLIIGAGLCAAAPGSGAGPAVLPDSWLRLIADEVNGYAAFNNLAMIATYHRTLGSDDTHEVLLRLKRKCEAYGLRDAVLLRVPVKTGEEFFGLQNFDGQVPTRGNRAELRLVKPFAKLLITTEAAPSGLIQGSLPADLTAPVVYVGKGIDPASYEGKDVKGKVVLAGNALPEDIKELAVHRYGAAGVLFYYDLPHNSGDDQDANLDTHWPPAGKDGREAGFGFSLSNNQYRFLKAMLDRGESVVVHARVECEIKHGEDAVFETLDAAIRGSEFPEEEFLLWAHIDHPLPGAVDNASGCAVILEVARTLQSLIDSGQVPRPKRTIRFLWLPHVTGLTMYFSRHPEKIGKVRGGLSVDSVGISQTIFSNYFAPCKPSHAFPSYWPAVLESLAARLQTDANRDLLDYRKVGGLFAPEGSRDQFHMRVIPFNGFGDEMQSNNLALGIPTIAFGCLPVPPRHSQVNFLSYVDPTGLHRVAYLGAGLAAVFGWTDGGNAGRVIDEVFAAGRSKLVQESNLAVKALADAGSADIAAAYGRGQSLLRCGEERERRALESIRLLVPAAKDALGLIEVRSREEADLVRSLESGLTAEYARRCAGLGVRPSPTLLNGEEAELDRLVPRLAPGVLGTAAYFGNYFEKTLGKARLDSFGLNPDFAYGHVGYTEAENFIDGRRSILAIYEATAAELWSEGYPSGHAISLREVASLMRMLEAAKVVTIERKAT